MKKIVLAASLFCSLVLSAQLDFRSTRFGIIAGYNNSRVHNAHNPSGSRHSFQAGVTAMIPIEGAYDQFYIQPELVYFGSGETGRDSEAVGMPGYNAKYYNNYISLPIYFKAYFSEAENEFFGLFGPRFSYLISQVSEGYAPNRPYYSIEGVDIPNRGRVNGKANSFDFSLSGGIGYSYKRKLELLGKYDISLSNAYPGLMNEPGSDPAIARKKTQHVVSLSLNYIFD